VDFLQSNILPIFTNARRIHLNSEHLPHSESDTSLLTLLKDYHDLSLCIMEPEFTDRTSMLSIEEVVQWLHRGGKRRTLCLSHEECLCLNSIGNERELKKLKELLLEAFLSPSARPCEYELKAAYSVWDLSGPDDRQVLNNPFWEEFSMKNPSTGERFTTFKSKISKTVPPQEYVIFTRTGQQC